MTVAENSGRSKQACNGILTTFPFTMGVADSGDIAVILSDVNGTETTLVEGVNYYVSCVNSNCSFGGSVVTTETNGTTPKAYAAGYSIIIVFDVPISQESDFTEGMATLYETFEQELDKQARILQQLREQIRRCFSVSVTVGAINPYTVPAPIANNLLGWNSAGTNLANFTTQTVTVPQIDHIGNYNDDLDAAITAIGSNPTTFMIPYAISLGGKSPTTPTTLDLWFTNGGRVNGTGVETLTVNGGIIAAPAHRWVGDDVTVDLSGAQIDEVHPKWFYTNTTPGITDVGAELQMAINSKKTIRLPCEEIYTGTTTPFSYKGQIIQGCGTGVSIITNDAPIGFALADSAGVYDRTTKALTNDTFLRDFTIRANATGAIGLQFVGANYNGFSNIEVEKDADEGAGARTGVGIHIGGSEKASANGCYYNNFEGITVKYFGTGLVYGPRAHSNGDITGVNISYCDTGVVEDDGTLLSYAAGKAFPAMFNLHGGAIEQINGTAIDLNSTDGTVRSISDFYIEGCTDGIIQEAGSTNLSAIRFSSISGAETTANGGSFICNGANCPEVLVSRSTNLLASPIIAAFYDNTDTLQPVVKPRIISFEVIQNGDGVNSYASTIVTFATLDADLPANMYIAGEWHSVIGSKVGGASNSLYNVGFSDTGDFASDTDMQINVRRVDGVAMAVDEAVRVKVYVLVYLP